MKHRKSLLPIMLCAAISTTTALGIWAFCYYLVERYITVAADG